MSEKEERQTDRQTDKQQGVRCVPFCLLATSFRYFSLPLPCCSRIACTPCKWTTWWSSTAREGPERMGFHLTGCTPSVLSFSSPHTPLMAHPLPLPSSLVQPARPAGPHSRPGDRLSVTPDLAPGLGCHELAGWGPPGLAGACASCSRALVLSTIIVLFSCFFAFVRKTFLA